jgi:DNA-binding NarL/FixJ family response regulator
MNEPVKTLVAVQSTERRDALQALLESIEHINTIYGANDIQTSIEMIKTHDPTLLVADFELFRAINNHHNAVVVVLVTDRHEQERARASGAIKVFIEGTPVNQLVDAIETLLAS